MHLLSVFLIFSLARPKIGMVTSGCSTPWRINNTGVTPDWTQLLIEDFKKSLLHGLKLKSAPSVSQTEKESIKRQLKNILREQQEQIEESDCDNTTDGLNKRVSRSVVRYEPQIIEKIIPASSIMNETLSTQNLARHYFNLSGLQIRSISQASITILLEGMNISENGNAILRVHEFVNENEINTDPVIVHGASLRPGDAYMSADITQLTRKWVEFPSSNYGLLIKIQMDGQDVTSRMLNETNRTPRVLLHLKFRSNALDTAWNVVSGNPTNICDPNGQIDACCRYPLTVDLEQVGFSFVIIPKDVTIFYCAGNCTVGHPATSPHAHLMQQLSQLRPNHKKAYGPCCVPTEFENLTVVYMPNGYSVQQTKVLKIIAQRCGCS